MRALGHSPLLLAASLMLAASLAVVGCGHDCGAGTYQDGRVCVAGLPVSCGPGTVEEGGRCRPTDGGGGAGCGEGTVLRAGECVPAMTPGANGSRFVTLVMSEPSDVAPLVNTVLGPAVGDGRVLLLWKPRGVTNGTPPERAMSFGSGTIVEQPDGSKTYVMSASVTTTTTALIQADGAFDTAPFTFKFPVFPEAGEAGLLLVEQTVATCKLGLANLLEPPPVVCNVLGGITQANADAVYIEVLGTTLGALLANEPLLFDCNLDGTPDDCWKMAATFTVETAVVDDELLLDGGV